MKKMLKNLICFTFAAAVSASLFADPILGLSGRTQTTKKEAAKSDIEVLQNSFRSVCADLLPSVVSVDIVGSKKTDQNNPFQNFPFFFFGNPGSGESFERETSGIGSGVIVRRDGDTVYVLTNKHVADDKDLKTKKLSVRLNDDRVFEAKLIGSDERYDIALISFESNDKSIPVAKLGDSDTVMPGDIVFAFGSPLYMRQSVTQGIVSAVGRDGSGIGNISDFIQTDAAINPGNSGGPLVNIYGEVIGINQHIMTQTGGSQGLGFAISINNVKNSIDSFITDGKIKSGWVGVSLLDINPDFKKELGVEGVDGAFAAEVFVGSPAFKCGIRPGDYIIDLNGKAVKSVNQLVREVGNLKAGTTAKFTVMRGGKKLPVISVKIEERSDEVAGSNNKLWPGFIATPLTDNVKKELDITDKKVRGVVVTNVQEKTPAAALRLRNGDVITAVNGKDVKDVVEFYAALAEVDRTVNFDIYSNGGTITTGTYKLSK